MTAPLLMDPSNPLSTVIATMQRMNGCFILDVPFISDCAMHNSRTGGGTRLIVSRLSLLLVTSFLFLSAVEDLRRGHGRPLR